MSDVETLEAENAELRRQLEECRSTVRAFEEGEVDAVATDAGRTPVLLREAQAAVREHEQFLRAVYDAAMDGLLVLDDEGVIVDANEAFARLAGCERRALLGRPLGDFVDPDEHATRWERMLDVGYVEDETVLHRVGGYRREVELRASAHILAGRHLAVFRDVTQQREVERELVQSQKMEALGQLAAGVAHDFNNMLAVIKGTASMMLSELQPSDPLREDVTEIREAAGRASELTRRLLVFGRRGEADATQTFDPNEALDGAEKLLGRVLGERIELELHRGDDVGQIRLDPVQLEQILVNLGLNARDAMPEGGRLTLETSGVRLSPQDARHSAWLPPGRYVRLAVRDTGQGMDASTQQQVFQPFFTTKGVEQGTGLGLSTVYGIVTQADGRITVDSTPGKGTTFEILLPETEPSAAAAEEEAQPVRMPETEQTVLLVEDEMLVRRLATRVLQRNGYRVLEAESAEEALSLVDSSEGSIDVVLTDLVMPGLYGSELAVQLAEIRPEVPVLYMSGYAQVELPTRPGAAGPATLLEKPFTPNELVDAVRSSLGEPDARAHG